MKEDINMDNEEIKVTCEELYDTIRSAKERLAEIRAKCPHDDTYEGLWAWAEGHIIHANICQYCGNFVSSREETFTPLKVTIS